MGKALPLQIFSHSVSLGCVPCLALHLSSRPVAETTEPHGHHPLRTGLRQDGVLGWDLTSLPASVHSGCSQPPRGPGRSLVPGRGSTPTW